MKTTADLFVNFRYVKIKDNPARFTLKALGLDPLDKFWILCCKLIVRTKTRFHKVLDNVQKMLSKQQLVMF